MGVSQFWIRSRLSESLVHFSPPQFSLFLSSSTRRLQRSLHRLVNWQKTRERRGRIEEKEYPKKRCLSLGHQKLFHGGDLPRSIPVRKGPLFPAYPPGVSSSLLPSPLCRPAYPGCLAKTRRLSLKVIRRNRRRVTRACKRVEEKSGRGKGEDEGRGRDIPMWIDPTWVGGWQEPRGRRCAFARTSRYITDTAENPLKGSTRNKGCSTPSLSPLCPSLFSRVLSRPRVDPRI